MLFSCQNIDGLPDVLNVSNLNDHGCLPNFELSAFFVKLAATLLAFNIYFLVLILVLRSILANHLIRCFSSVTLLISTVVNVVKNYFILYIMKLLFEHFRIITCSNCKLLTIFGSAYEYRQVEDFSTICQCYFHLHVYAF
uniref:Uncharacterized protein n=1 Tax=Heterorhabditis bacteriophora TaxID=37862 RepID=A0A1I7WC02_HETBA